MEKSWDKNTRLLHWAMMVTVLFQQLSSIWMSDPGTQYLFPYHRIIGAIAAAVVLLFWLYSYAIYDFKILFPWGKESRREVWQELLGLFRRKLPQSGHRLGLSSFVHGLGILALTGCAITGVIMFAMIPPGHSGPPDDPIAFTSYTMKHKFFGEMLWLYLYGHVTFAVIHQLAGDNVFGAIFSLRRGDDDTRSDLPDK
jgi:cytochrome b561